MSKSHRNKGQLANEEIICDLMLFVTGATPNSVRAVTNIRTICDKYLEGKYSINIVDIYKERDIAIREQLVAIPMLIIHRKQMSPRKLIGDLSDTKKVLDALGIKEEFQ